MAQKVSVVFLIVLLAFIAIPSSVVHAQRPMQGLCFTWAADFKQKNNRDATREELPPGCAEYFDQLPDSAANKAKRSSGIIPCTDDCGFNDLLQLINNVIQFSIDFLVLPIFIAILIYAGYLYLTANGKPGVHAKVKSMLWKALLGLLLVLCSWLIVKVLLTAIGYEPGLRFLE